MEKEDDLLHLIDPETVNLLKKQAPSFLPLSYVSPSPSTSTLRTRFPPPSPSKVVKMNRKRSTPLLLSAASSDAGDMFSPASEVDRMTKGKGKMLFHEELEARPLLFRRRSSLSDMVNERPNQGARALSSDEVEEEDEGEEGEGRKSFIFPNVTRQRDVQHSPSTPILNPLRRQPTPEETLDLLLSKSSQLLFLSNSVLTSTIASRAHFARFFALEDSLELSNESIESQLRSEMTSRERVEEKLLWLENGGVDVFGEHKLDLRTEREKERELMGESDPREFLLKGKGGHVRAKPQRGHTLRVTADVSAAGPSTSSAGARRSGLPEEFLESLPIPAKDPSTTMAQCQEEPSSPVSVEAKPTKPATTPSAAASSLLLALSLSSPPPKRHQKTSSFSFSSFSPSAFLSSAPPTSPSPSPSRTPSPLPPPLPPSEERPFSPSPSLTSTSTTQTSITSDDNRRFSQSSITTSITTAATSPRSSLMSSLPPLVCFETILEAEGDPDSPGSIATAGEREENEVASVVETEDTERERERGKAKRRLDRTSSSAATITPLSVTALTKSSLSTPPSSRILHPGRKSTATSLLSTKSRSSVALSSPSESTLTPFPTLGVPSSSTSASYSPRSSSPLPPQISRPTSLVLTEPTPPQTSSTSHHRRSTSTTSLSHNHNPPPSPTPPTKFEEVYAKGSHVHSRGASAVQMVENAVRKEVEGRKGVEENLGKEKVSGNSSGRSWWGWS